MIKIYVSSTFEDLKEFRRAVYSQLRKLRIDAVSMEDYVASEKRPLAKCLEDVAEADVYLGIFAWRYGYIPKEGNSESRSITELEYRTAGEHAKERLIFLLRDDAPWTPSLMDTHTGEGDGGKQIERLREQLSTDHAVGFFSTPDDLAKEVSAAVTNILLRPLSQVQDHPDDLRQQSSLQATSRGLNLYWGAYKEGLKVASSIGRIEKSNMAGMGFASGFLVSGSSLHARFGSDLYLLTPAHVIVKEKTQNSFGLTLDECRFRLTIPEEGQKLIRLEDIAWSSPVNELDLNVIKLERQPKGVLGLAVAKYLPLVSEELEFDMTQCVIVIGHPQGGQLSFSLGGFFLEHDDAALQYEAIGTSGGSGGSAVLNENWQAIGVHRLRGNIPRLSGKGRVEACQGVSLLAIRQALKKEFG